MQTISVSRWWAVFAGLVLLAAVVRLYHLGYQSLWLDEAISVQDVALKPTLREALVANARVDTNPPLYNALLHVWCRMGRSETWVRLPSAICGVLATGSVMLLLRGCGRAWNQPSTTALVAGLICALSPFQIWYSQEARYYAPLLLLTVALYGCLVGWLMRGERTWLAAAAVVQTLLVYTHVFGWCSVLAALVSAWWLRRERVTMWLMSVLVAVVAFLFFLPQMWEKSQDALTHGIAGYGARLDPLRLGHAVFVLAMGFGIGPPLEQLHMPGQARAVLAYGPVVLPAVIAVAWAGGGGLQSALRTRVLSGLLLPWLGVPLLGLLAASALGIVGANARYLAGAAPALAVLLAMGLQGTRPAGARVALAILFFLCMLFSLARCTWDPEWGKEDWRRLSRVLLERGATSREVLATVDVPLRYYTAGALDPQDIRGPLTGRRRERFESALAGAGARLWLVYTRPWDFDPDGSLLQALDTHWRRSSEERFVGIRLFSYERVP